MKGISNRQKPIVVPRERSDKFAVKSKKILREIKKNKSKRTHS
jgi:hypothetical protein